MKELILLCTKGVHFTLCGDSYIQTDGVAMGSPLGPVLSGIFMVELENTLVPTLTNHLICWKRYVDDTNCFINENSIPYVISVLNSFHPSIQFTYETESNNRLSFLDVLIIRNGQNIETCVYRKPTNTDIYIHWNSFAPIQWKRSTLKTLVYRSYLVCSNDHYLTLELNYLRKVFNEYNNYPHWFITQVFNDVNNVFNQQHQTTDINNTTIAEENNSKKQIMKLPYAGERGCSIIKSLKKHLKQTLPANIKADIVYTGTKLSSQLSNIKDSTPFEEQHDLIYHSICNNENCNDDYIGEIARRLKERVKDHNGRDKSSHLVKHSIESGHDPVCNENFRILDRGYSNTFKRKVAEALLIKKHKPTLNVQEKSVKLELFN